MKIIKKDIKKDIKNKILIDTLTDLPHKKPFPNYLKLSYLALECGIFLQDAHRAINDVLCLHRVLKNFNLSEIIDLQSIKPITIFVNISYSQLQTLSETDKPRAKGFRWNAEKREWTKIITGFEAKNFQLEKFQENLKFEVLIKE